VDANFEINAALRGPGRIEPATQASEWATRQWFARRGLTRLAWAAWKGLQLLLKFDGVVFFGGYFYPEREKDGYFQRIRSVDGLVSDGWRVYVENEGLPGRQAVVDRPEARVLVFRIVGGALNRALLRAAVAALALRSRKIYFHSVLSMRNGFQHLMRVPFMRSAIDVHGVVPEEFRMHGDYYNAVAYERKEEFAYRHAKRVVAVSDAMRRYLSGKYRDWRLPVFVNFPIFPVADEYRGPRAGREPGEAPVAVYAGGLHKWQQPEKTLRAMMATQHAITSYFLSPDPAAAEELASEVGSPDSIRFGSMSHEELLRFYRGCDFGYILREDNIVNNVACPTKVVEYLANGIVPIVDSENFGDFKALGMRSVTVDQLEKGEIPDEAHRRALASANFRVYNKMRKAKDNGGREISRYLGRRRTGQPSLAPSEAAGSVDVLVQVGNFEAGGLENVVLELNEYLRECGFRIALLIHGTEGWAVTRARELGQRVIAMPYDTGSHRALLDTVKPSVVLTHYSIDGLDVCSARAIPVIQVIHNIYMWLAGAELSAFVDAAALTSRFVAVSAAVKDYSIEKFGIDGSKCDVIENGIDLGKFPVDDRMGVRERLRARHGIGTNDFVFLDMAAINHQKNHRDVVLAFAQAVQGCDNARLVIVGPCYEPQLLEELKVLVERFALGQRVTIIERTASPWEFHAMADAFVSASFFEGGPLTLLEALACNLPVVFPRVGMAVNFEGRRGVHLVDPAVDIKRYHGDMASLRSSPDFVHRLARAMMDLWCNPVRPDLAAGERAMLDKEHCFGKYADLITSLSATSAVHQSPD
jgi:glycosyltransferase involved in cell wall biosynthesis